MSEPTIDLDQLQALAGLDLDATEATAVRARLAKVLEWFDQLAAIDTEGVEPTATALTRGTPLREDEPVPCLPVEEGLASAPQALESFFVVPPILGGDAE